MNNQIEIFAGTLMEASIVKTLLEDAGIETFIKDEIMSTMFPWQTASGGAFAIKLIISSKDFDTAKLIVEEYNFRNQD